MTIQFESKLDSGKVWDDVQKRIEDQRENYRLWKIVESVLAQFDGKKITKRIETALRKELPEYTLYYSTQYGMYHIYLWGNGIPYDRRKGYLIGYDDCDTLDIVKVADRNQCHELDKSRADKTQELTKDVLYMNIEKWNNALEALQQVNKWSREFGIEYLAFDVK